MKSILNSMLSVVKDLHTDQVVMTRVLKDGLYMLDTNGAMTRSASHSSCKHVKSANNSVNICSSNSIDFHHNNIVSKDIWYQRLGHPSSRVFNTVVKLCNLLASFNTKPSFCNACKLGKMHALPFSDSTSRATATFSLFHTHLWGPVPILSNEGF